MKITAISSCYIGPAISPEQFVAEHFFLYLVKGSIAGYDGHKRYSMKAGEYCLVRKNQLARYSKQPDQGAFSKVVIIFDEAFLKGYQKKHKPAPGRSSYKSAFIQPGQTPRIENFVRSLEPYYKGEGRIDPVFADLKREELLLILLQIEPGLADLLFDFGVPEKIDLEAYMNKNYRFNVSLERFAFLTGRSLSAFKRDFDHIFHETPSRWLLQKRLREGYFLIEKKAQKPSDIYLDLGFEDLSHFSFAFKKMFGVPPTNLIKK